MKKNTLRKCIAMAMVLGMSFATAGCTNDANTSTAGTTSKSGSSSTSSSADVSQPAERQTLTFMTIEYTAGTANTGEYAEEILTTIEDYTNVDLEITWVLSDALGEKINLTMANPSTMPMVITHGGSLTGNIVSAAKAGAFVDLNDYIWDEGKYPNLSQMNKSVASSLSVGGALVAIPRTRDIGRYGMSYRVDWAEAVGITEEPKTIEDVYDMLYKFTYEDPDGNGVDDTFGMEMTSYTGPFDIIQTWFGAGNGWADVDGELIPVHMQDEYIEALDWLRQVYDEGLMPPDWAVRTTDTWSNGTKTGEAGVYIDVMDGGRRIWDYFAAEATYTPSVVNPDEGASMNLLGAINEKTLATSGYNGFFTLSATTCDTPEKIEAALNFLDKVNDNEMRLIMENGIEDVHYEVVDGFMVKKDLTNEPGLSNNNTGLNQMIAYIPSYNVEPGVEQTDRTLAQKEVIAENEMYAVFNPALSYLANSETNADLGSSLAEIITQARTQYIYGEIDMAGLEDAHNNWLNQGGQDIIDEVNAQHAENQ